MAMVLAQQESARARIPIERSRMWSNTVRAALTFGILILHVPHFVGILCFWPTVAFLLAASRNFYEYRCARIQSNLWPD